MGIFDIFKLKQIKQENEKLRYEVATMQSKIQTLGITEYEQTKKLIDELKSKSDTELHISQNQIDQNNNTILKLNDEITSLNEKNEKLSKSVLSQERKISRCKELYKSIDYSINNFFESDVPLSSLKLPEQSLNDIDTISPSIILKLHCMDVKDLRKAYRENDKLITKVLEQYSSRYTSKSNQAIYQLMVIALRAELQNILYNLKYEKLEKSIDDVKSVTQKYLQIASDGNQTIAGTLSKFIGEIEYLFINSVKIEYNYYVKKEQAKQEQLALKEQMKQEAEERKALENERKKIENEEKKYNSEIEKLTMQIENAQDDETDQLNARILELQAQLSDVILKKDEIAKLANGKAGNVYIISNLGSFGDSVFKIGMTRRLEPQDRINELGSASVPFKFDVHSFIFSDDAVGLESKLHEMLTEKRLNKVNLRKEFFSVSIDELEEIVTSIDPTAEFNKTMIAEEYRQSISSEFVYTSDYVSEDDDNDEEQ